MVYVIVDRDGAELARLDAVERATRTARGLEGAIAVVSESGVLLARVERGTADGERAALRAAQLWAREHHAAAAVGSAPRRKCRRSKTHLSEEQVATVHKLRSEGLGWRRVALALALPASTLRRVAHLAAARSQ